MFLYLNFSRSFIVASKIRLGYFNPNNSSCGNSKNFSVQSTIKESQGVLILTVEVVETQKGFSVQSTIVESHFIFASTQQQKTKEESSLATSAKCQQYNSASTKQQRLNMSKVRCQYCHQLSHMKHDCPMKEKSSLAKALHFG